MGLAPIQFFLQGINPLCNDGFCPPCCETNCLSVVYNSDCDGGFSVYIECVSVVCFYDSKIKKVYTVVNFSF